MKLLMTFFTNRNNIKPMFWFIALVVMILFSLFTTQALQGIGARQFANCNSIIYGICCPSVNFTLLASPITLLSNIIFSAFSVFFFPNFTFFALLISSLSSPAFSSFSITNSGLMINNFTFFTLVITKGGLSMHCFTTFCLTIFFDILQKANFAIAFVCVFFALVFVKFRQRLDLFAFGTSFRYDLLRHNQLHNSWLCLEPVAGYASAVGSPYYIRTLKKRKKKTQN